MPESEVFLETYLREIGVHTPVSLLTSGLKKHQQMEKEQQAVQTESVRSIENRSSIDASPSIFRTMDELAQEASSCRLCSLADTRSHVVFGGGNAQADLVFVGEAPGRDEDSQGEPFVGGVGQLLDRMLKAMQLDRKQIYMMNTTKCRPPNSRDPRPDEVQSCKLWFDQQLDILQPKMICLLGRVAAQTVLETDAPLASLRGRWHDYQGIPVWVTYHPAYLLRSPRQKQKSWQDMICLAQHFQALR